MFTSSLSDRLGTLGPFSLALDNGPLGAAVFTLVATWGMMNLLAIVIELRILWPSQQYDSFYKGDSIGLPTIMGAIVAMGFGMPIGRYWYQESWWHLTVLAVGLAIGVGFTVLEYRQGVYDLRTILSPTKIYHNVVVFPVLIYLVFGNGLPILLYSNSGPRAAVSGDMSGIAPLLLGVVATAYYVRLLWRDVTNRSIREGKFAHSPVKSIEGLLALIVLAVVGASFLLGAPRPQSLNLWLLALLSAGIALYFTCWAKDLVHPEQFPWAHVPFRMSYMLWWIGMSEGPPWGWDTRGLPSPRVVATAL